MDDLDNRTKVNPQAFELYASLLADIDAVIYQTAKDAIKRTRELVPEVMRLRHPSPTRSEIVKISENLQSQAMHSATIGYHKAAELGIPAEYLSPSSEQWDMLWRLHAHYVFLLGPYPTKTKLVEGRRVSFQFG